MMRPLRRFLGRPKAAFSQPPFWANPSAPWSSLSGDKETIGTSFESYVRQAYKRNGVVFACILARMLVFSEVTFQWRRQGGRPSDLFSSPELDILERPWPAATTGDLLSRMEQDASLAGNFFATTVEDRIRRMRPDWVTIVTGSKSGEGPYALDAEPAGFVYLPKHGWGLNEPVLLTPNQVAHYAPIPDPEAQWRGMSWLQPVVEEIQGDSAATRHKKRFFDNGAVLGTVITYDKEVNKEAFDFFVEKFKEQHQGADNAYRTLHLGGGADVKTAVADFQQLDFKKTQGAGETRIAAAAGVHPVIVGLSEGLQGSALNAGNYAQVRRRFADMTIRPLWRGASAALESLVTKPADAGRLWYSDRDIPFLRDDAKQEAEIGRIQATTLTELVRNGFTAESAIEAVTTNDYSALQHSGLLSVQLQPADDTEGMNVATLALALQKIYLAVGKVITADEAREILNREGAGLTGPFQQEDIG